MLASIHYDSIGRTVTQRTSLSLLSGRDKVNLLKDLLDDLGITKRLLNEPETRFEQIWKEQTAIEWNQQVPHLTTKPMMY